MIFPVLILAMLGAAIMAVLVPLSRRRAALEGSSEVPFYRDQLGEIARDEQRGLISPAEAEGARTEAGRRLIRASEQTDAATPPDTVSSLWRRRGAAALLLVVVPAVSIGVYAATGSPRLADGSSPASTAIAADPNSADALLARVEAQVEKNPDDRRGWEVVAPIYLRGGRFDDASRAYSNLIRLGADGADELGGLAEAMVGSNGGVVSAEARQVLERAAARDPNAPRVQFYLALSAEQDGNADTAKAGYEQILSHAAPDAPYRRLVQARLRDLTNNSEAHSQPIQATPEITAMVDGLDRRLSESGGSGDEWMRLVRAMTVLGRNDDARDRLAKARLALANNADALHSLDEEARGLGLDREAQR